MSTETYYGTGRRKTSTARVYIRPGTGNITVNRQPLDEFFGRKTARMVVSASRWSRQIWRVISISVLRSQAAAPPVRPALFATV